jgi:tetratricopeptide (TPR) repeat protein
VPRYRYRRPAAPLPGDREKAEVELNEGLKLHRAGRQSLAVNRYQAAVKLDPSYFEAYYNQGLAGYQTADWQLSLLSYEYALALVPDSANAHYNFCLALKQANYPLDAVEELKKLIQNHPGDARAHQTLGNLYAQQFNDLKRARVHYIRVLELDPRHPEAARIRYWLAANP